MSQTLPETRSLRTGSAVSHLTRGEGLDHLQHDVGRRLHAAYAESMLGKRTDPAHMRWMSEQVPRGDYLFCPGGSHLCMWDDQQTYMAGLVRFLKAVDAGQK